MSRANGGINNKDCEMRRLNVNLPEEVIQALRRIADRHNITMTEALRRAIVTEDFLERETAQGGKVLIKTKDDSIKEVVRP